MRLVDGERSDVPVLQVLLPVVEEQAFRRDVEQAPFVPVEAAETRAGFLGGKGGVEVGRGDTGGLQLVNLVLHQRDERRDDDRQAGTDEGGKLEAEGFAATGGQEREGVAACEMGFDDLALQRTECAVAEGSLERSRSSGTGKGTGEVHGGPKMMKAEKRLFQPEPTCKLAQDLAHRVPAADRPAEHPQAARDAVGLGVNVTDEFQAGEEGQRVIAAFPFGGRGVDLPGVVEIPQRAGDRAGVEQGIQRGEQERRHCCS